MIMLPSAEKIPDKKSMLAVATVYEPSPSQLSALPALRVGSALPLARQRARLLRSLRRSRWRAMRRPVAALRALPALRVGGALPLARQRAGLLRSPRRGTVASHAAPRRCVTRLARHSGGRWAAAGTSTHRAASLPAAWIRLQVNKC